MFWPKITVFVCPQNSIVNGLHYLLVQVTEIEIAHCHYVVFKDVDGSIFPEDVEVVLKNAH